jgi:hypothetical protein
MVYFGERGGDKTVVNVKRIPLKNKTKGYKNPNYNIL